MGWTAAPTCGPCPAPSNRPPASTRRVLSGLATAPYRHEGAARVQGAAEHIRSRLPAGVATVAERAALLVRTGDPESWFRAELRVERLDCLPAVLESLDRPFFIEGLEELRGASRRSPPGRPTRPCGDRLTCEGSGPAHEAGCQRQGPVPAARVTRCGALGGAACGRSGSPVLERSHGESFRRLEKPFVQAPGQQKPAKRSRAGVRPPGGAGCAARGRGRPRPCPPVGPGHLRRGQAPFRRRGTDLCALSRCRGGTGEPRPEQDPPAADGGGAQGRGRRLHRRP